MYAGAVVMAGRYVVVGKRMPEESRVIVWSLIVKVVGWTAFGPIAYVVYEIMALSALIVTVMPF